MTIIRRTWGPRHTERELRRMNYAGTLGEHASCWVNGACDKPDCVAGHYSGEPVRVRAFERRLPRQTPGA